VNGSGFAAFVARQRGRGRLVVQPRMGFGRPEVMREGLLAVKAARAVAAGTITLDSYTRLDDHRAAGAALRQGHDLNGFPIVAHGPAVTRRMLAGVVDRDFPVQVRHGSPRPRAVFEALLASGLDATEGGPVSYCLPYGRAPLRSALHEWTACCRLLAGAAERGVTGHLESFGGCMLGQLCPPGLLVALSILEALFFRQHGVRSVSLSYAQQTSHAQDVEAVLAMRRLAARHLDDVDWHVVVYTHMGVYPRTPTGAARLLGESVRLAVATGSERLIVKTPVEAFRIPTIAENVGALEQAAAFAAGMGPVAVPAPGHEVEAEAGRLVDTVLDLAPDLGRALELAFARGLLDVPFCLHPDNRNQTRSYIDERGFLRWAAAGALPLPRESLPGSRREATSAHQLLTMLTYNQRRFDGHLGPGPDPRALTAHAWRGAAREMTL
jgi:methylaspartate mutase epsilon subunit